eukprot:CAMPEP_0204333304 /NCGR_PEP_ID=MMETSP0469-20131031/17111_1 /ASSEMBLY_ACC=CAM_ASM_000384 /TAXON_ID=2969 /ORGANISM="Oxyrrhis marina" /LENGTH=529 /DNA_ID=CAMNT_0051316627 /DNA_START=30 /DNA_END=1619 /DNA_ORIENTATION=-
MPVVDSVQTGLVKEVARLRLQGFWDTSEDGLVVLEDMKVQNNWVIQSLDAGTRTLSLLRDELLIKGSWSGDCLSISWSNGDVWRSRKLWDTWSGALSQQAAPAGSLSLPVAARQGSGNLQDNQPAPPAAPKPRSKPPVTPRGNRHRLHQSASSGDQPPIAPVPSRTSGSDAGRPPRPQKSESSKDVQARAEGSATTGRAPSPALRQPGTPRNTSTPRNVGFASIETIGFEKGTSEQRYVSLERIEPLERGSAGGLQSSAPEGSGAHPPANLTHCNTFEEAPPDLVVPSRRVGHGSATNGRAGPGAPAPGDRPDRGTPRRRDRAATAESGVAAVSDAAGSSEAVANVNRSGPASTSRQGRSMSLSLVMKKVRSPSVQGDPRPTFAEDRGRVVEAPAPVARTGTCEEHAPVSDHDDARTHQLPPLAQRDTQAAPTVPSTSMLAGILSPEALGPGPGAHAGKRRGAGRASSSTGVGGRPPSEHRRNDRGTPRRRGSKQPAERGFISMGQVSKNFVPGDSCRTFTTERSDEAL